MRYVACVLLIGVVAFSGCRLGAKNEDKLAALKDGYVYDEDQSISADGSVSIDAGASATKSTSVTLTLSAENAREMYVTHDAGCESGGSWEAYSTSKSWTLAQTNSTATVYAVFRATTGKLSDCVSDTIRHDSLGPEITISAPSQSSVNTGSATYSITYSDASEITLSNSDITLTKSGTANASFALSGTGGTRTLTLSSITGKGTIQFSIAAGTAKDSLGNLSTAAGPSATVTIKEATSLVSGYQHFCVTLGNDEVQCWGTNPNQTLGNNSAIDSRNPVKVQGLEGLTISKLHGGGYYNCVLLTDQTVRCWGDNGYGQMGINSAGADAGVAIQVLNSSGTGPLSGVSALAAGGLHVCALMSDQTVECWGQSTSGQLGDNTVTLRYLPVKVKDASGVANLTGVQEIVAGTAHTCARLSSSDVRCWGGNNYGNVGDNTTGNRRLPTQVKNSNNTGALTGVSKLFAGNYNTCAIHADGTATCWGYNEHGAVGNNGTGTIVRNPTTVLDSTGTAALSGITDISGCNYGGTIGAIAGASNQLYVWGSHDYGQLGLNTLSKSHYLPNPALGLSGTGILTGVSQFAASRTSSCVIMSSDKQVRCWGYGLNEEVGRDVLVGEIDTPTPMKDSGGSNNLTGVTAFGVSGTQTCVQNGAGIQCWGMNSAGALGNNTFLSARYPTPVEGMQTGFSNLSTGNAFACAIRDSDQTLWCWGDNGYGQLGINTTGDSKVPVQVKNPANSGALTGVTHVSAAPGSTNTCAISNGIPYCWGLNTSMQSGNNSSSTNMKLPNAVKDSTGTGTLSGATAIAAESASACAIIDGGVQCWGSGTYGKLGNNQTAHSGVAVQVPGLTTGVSHISIGTYHACALKTDNTLWCWGTNTYGQLGTGDTTTSLVPVQVSTLSGTPSLMQAFIENTCVVISGGLQCWGRNTSGNLGSGFTAQDYSTTPVHVAGATSGVTQIYHGRNPCIQADGLVKCWGGTSYNRIQTEGHYLTPGLILPWAE